MVVTTRQVSNAGSDVGTCPCTCEKTSSRISSQTLFLSAARSGETMLNNQRTAPERERKRSSNCSSLCVVQCVMVLLKDSNERHRKTCTGKRAYLCAYNNSTTVNGACVGTYTCVSYRNGQYIYICRMNEYPSHLSVALSSVPISPVLSWPVVSISPRCCWSSWPSTNSWKRIVSLRAKRMDRMKWNLEIS